MWIKLFGYKYFATTQYIPNEAVIWCCGRVIFLTSNAQESLTNTANACPLISMDWNEQFLALFTRCLEAYQSGNTDFNSYYSEEDLAFLASIGYKPREFFDFVEDYGDAQSPSPSSALLVAAARRDYFFAMQEKKHSSKEVSGADLPSKTDTLEGIAYLPRIIAKAEAKLRGELHPNIMYGCAGDRGFLKKHGEIPLADFLRNVWAAKGDEQVIVKNLQLHS